MVEKNPNLHSCRAHGEFSLHLSYIMKRMLDIFAAGGHHNYAKAAQLYVQMMPKYGEGSSRTKGPN